MQTPKNTRPPLFADPLHDRFTAIITALSAEVSTVADRLDSMETLLVQKGVLQGGELDAFSPDEPNRLRRKSAHQAFLNRVFYILKDEFDALG